METETAAPRVRPGLTELFVVLGGGAAVAGSFLEWFRVHYALRSLGLVARSVTQKGIDGPDGKITLIAGAVVVLMGLLMFLWTSGSQRIAMGVVALLAGLSAAGLSGYDAMTPRQRFIDAQAPELAGKVNIPLAMAQRLYRGLFNSGSVRISLAFGVFVVIAGGAVAAIAAGVALSKSPEVPDVDLPSEPVATEPAGPAE